MTRALRTLLLAVAIPALALLIVGASESHLESLWRDEVVRELGPQSGDVLDRVRLVALCPQPEVRAQLRDTCQMIDVMELVKPAAIVAIGISLAALLGLVPLRRFATRNRRLLSWFRPFLVILLLVLTILVLLDGALVAAAAYIAESVYTNGVHPFVMFGIGVAVLVGASGVLRAAVTMGRVRPTEVTGLALDRERDGPLFELVDDVAARVGAAGPDQIIAGLDPTFFVTEAPVAAADGTYRGRTLFLSVPFIRILSRSELIAVIGHELGHFRGSDTLYSQRFYPVYRGSLESLAVLRGSANGWQGIPLLPPLMILELFFESFAGAERSLSRQRELAADGVGAEAASAEDVASSLVKLEAFGSTWGEAYGETRMAIRDAQQPGNLSSRFAKLARLSASPATVADVDHGRIQHPTDSHPPTSERVRALGIDARAAAVRALDLDPADGAFRLIDKGESLDEDLMEDLVARLSGMGTGTLPFSIADEATGRSGPLREAAAQDTWIAALIELIEPIRGPDLQPWLRTNVAWITLADLDVRPHLEPTGFIPLVPESELPSGDQALVVGVASGRTPLGLQLPRGSRMRLVGISLPQQRQAGRTELMLSIGGRIVTIRLVGDWPLDHQIGGALVVPEVDPLANPDGTFATRLGAVVDGLRARDAKRGHGESSPSV